MADSSSSGSSTSSSTSTPTFLETPENGILDQIAGYAQQLAGQMYSWAQSTYAQTSQITNQAVNNFFNVSQQMSGLATNMTNQYNNLFAPENAQLVADANSYASPERMAVDMGMAGATQGQAGDQAIKNSEQNLLSYGIDPSAGRYASLDKAAAVQNAANVAGAENVQRNADIATGQKLRGEAVQVGAQLPGAITNANNTAIQANTGASNASLANANTGANLFSLPDKYLGTAMGLKLPPTGQNTQSGSQSQNSGRSSSPNPSSGGNGGGGPGAGVGGGGGGNGGYNGMAPNTAAMSDGAVGRGLPGAGILHPGQGQPDAGVLPVDQIPDINPETGLSTMLDGIDFGQWTNQGTGGIGAPTTDAFPEYGAGTTEGAGAFGNSYGQDWGNGNTADPEVFGGGANGGFNGLGDFAQNDQNLGLGDFSYNPGANQAQLPPDWNDPPPQMSSDPGVWGDSSGGGDNSGGSVFDSGASSYDYGNGSDAFAAGGPVPASASPSHGRKVDDVPAQMPNGSPARLNAHEYVIPEDVARWKGQEFFHNMIAQSRKKRAMMQTAVPVGPKAMPARPGAMR